MKSFLRMLAIAFIGTVLAWSFVGLAMAANSPAETGWEESLSTLGNLANLLFLLLMAALQLALLVIAVQSPGVALLRHARGRRSKLPLQTAAMLMAAGLLAEAALAWFLYSNLTLQPGAVVQLTNHGWLAITHIAAPLAMLTLVSDAAIDATGWGRHAS